MNMNHTSPQIDGSQALKDLVKAVGLFARDTNFEFASAILNENARLSKQVESQQAEIESLVERDKEREAKKQTTYREILDMNEKEKLNNIEARKEIELLKSKIHGNEDVIAELRRRRDDLDKVAQEEKLKYNEEKEKVVQANKDISELEKVMKEKETKLDEYKAAGTKLKRVYDSLQIKYKELETSKSSVEEDIKNKSQRLEKLEGYAVQFYDDTESVLLEKFFDLWEYCSETMVHHLANNISKDRLEDSQALKKLKMPSIMHHQIPLPPSNTNAAKQMRLAVFMAILARELTEHIFQPFYLPPSDSFIQEILIQLAKQDPEKESFCRALLLAISPERQNAILEERKQEVLQNVGSCFSDLLPTTQYDELRKGLKLVVDRACETWRFFQYNRNRYEPDHELREWADGEWEAFPFAADSDTSQNQGFDSKSDEPILAIFPRICRVDNGGSKPLNLGTVLTRSQCIGAERELKKKEPSSPRLARVNSDRPRTRNMSISFGRSPDQNGTFLGNGDQASN